MQPSDTASQPAGYSSRGKSTAGCLVVLTTVGVVMAGVAYFVLRGQPPGGRRTGDAVFDLSRAAIPRNEILSGGVPIDGIPALTRPTIEPGDQQTLVSADDRVVGVVIDGEARAYPLRVLAQHEIVNDEIAGRPVAVTYCPLCDSVAVFDRRLDGKAVEFGVSGRLYNSNVLMYDRGGTAKSLFSQLGAAAVAGPRLGAKLDTLPSELTTWSAWRRRHPQTGVLTGGGGPPRDYGLDPYAAYFATSELMFPVRNRDDRLPPKERVLGVWSGSTARAYPLRHFRDTATREQMVTLEQNLGQDRLTLTFDADSRTLRVSQASDGVRWMYSFWFAWAAFHPNSSIFTGASAPPRSDGVEARKQIR